MQYKEKKREKNTSPLWNNVHFVLQIISKMGGQPPAYHKLWLCFTRLTATKLVDNKTRFCHSEFSVHLFCLLYCVSVHHIQKFEFDSLFWGLTLSFGVHIIELPFYSMKNVKISPCFRRDYVKIQDEKEQDNVKYLRICGSDYVKNVIFAAVIKDFRYG